MLSLRANSDVAQAVYAAIDRATYMAVGGAVDWNSCAPLSRVVYQAVNGAMNVAVHVAVSRREEPTHPGLGLYLAAVG